MDKQGFKYTVMVIPGRNGGRSFSLGISKAMIVVAAVLSGMVLLNAARKMHLLSELKVENTRLKNENLQWSHFYPKIAHMDSLAVYLGQLAAIVPPSTKPGSASTPGPDTFSVPFGLRGEDELAGSAEEGAPAAEDSMPTTPPVRGWITQKFFSDTLHKWATHPGIDIAAAEGTEIVAPAPGKVADLKVDEFYGNLVVLNHAKGYVTRFGHCSKVFVLRGQKIARGQRIALVGNTGHSTAPHLHYEVIKDGKYMNPLGFIVAGK